MVRRVDYMLDTRTQEANRLQSGVTEPLIRESIEGMIIHIDQQIAAIEQTRRRSSQTTSGLGPSI